MENTLKEQIIALTKEYVKQKFSSRSFTPGITNIPISGKIFDEHEVCNLIESALDFHLTTYRFNDSFEKKLREFIGVKFALTCNSGSSANLIAFSALTSPLLKERKLIPGDEVITVAAGFPTTVNPILQNGLTPVFLDVALPTYNIDIHQLENGLSDKTRAVMIAHTLGNPFDLEAVKNFTEKYNLFLIEDCCDALGSTYNNKSVGTFGDIATLSFYPAHHITMGEGGAVLTNNPVLKKAMESIRDWGRDCWCAPGCDNTCHKRFDTQFGQLPQGYDHKYVYSHLGYNLKITDMQAAVADAQMEKLPEFIKIRKRNFQLLSEKLSPLSEYFILPEATPNSDPSWFGFLLTIKNNAPFTRHDILQYLNKHKIGTRLLFAGNLTKQPYTQNQHYRIAGSLNTTDNIMHNTFWIGLYQGITPEMIQYMSDTLYNFIKEKIHES